MSWAGTELADAPLTDSREEGEGLTMSQDSRRM
jgi:hypothetical protein